LAEEPSVTEIRIPVPRLPRGLASNLLGLLGLVAAVLSIGGLTHNWWWSVLAGGIVAVVLSVVAQTEIEVDAKDGKPRLAAAKSA
jgi:hypothetical protein